MGIPYLAGVEYICGMSFASGSGDSADGRGIQIGFYAGGALAFDTALAAETARPVSVDGAVSAVVVGGNDRYEGSWDVLLVSDGVNVLAVYSDGIAAAESYIPLAEAVLGLTG